MKDQEKEKLTRGEVYLISDTHFFHFNIIRYCNRPFDDDVHMNSEMERRWSLLVQPEDIIIVVGDLTAGLQGRKDELKELIGRLPGKKILVKGNHDHQKDEFYIEAGFLSVVDYIYVNGLLFVHVPDTGDVKMGHPHPWSQVTKALREKHSPALTIHGHDHRASIPEFEGHFNCAADRHNYMPFTLASALQRSGLEAQIEQSREDIYSWLEKEVAKNVTKNVAIE